MRVISQFAALFTGKKLISVNLVSNTTHNIPDLGRDDFIGIVEDGIEANNIKGAKTYWRRLNLKRVLRTMFSKRHGLAIREEFQRDLPARSLDGERDGRSCSGADGSNGNGTILSIHQDAVQHIVGAAVALADAQQACSPCTSYLLNKLKANQVWTMDSVKELTIEINSEKQMKYAKLIDERQQYFLATEPSQIASETDDFMHSYIDDTLEAINAYLRSTDAAPTVCERDSVVDNVSFNATAQSIDGNYQNIYDVSPISDISSSQYTGKLPKESDSVVGLMTTFARYMLSVSEDLGSTKARDQAGSSIVCDSTNASLLRLNLKPPYQEVVACAKCEPPIQKILNDSWGKMTPYLPGNGARNSSSTISDHMDIRNHPGPSQFQSENIYMTRSNTP
ncbi:hypothetical protein V1509DRAFT_614410 [Lipomyces kononenkoae]